MKSAAGAEFPCTLSPEALAFMKRWLSRKGQPGQFIRVGVKGGGCSGFEYLIQLDSRDLPIDLVCEFEGLKVVCDSKSAEFIKGSELIFTGNLMGGSLQFENPNAARSCGCGTSFTPKA